MRDLAKESGVAPKTLYHQFQSKEKLLLTAVEERFRYLYQAIDDADIERGVDRLFYIIDTVARTTKENRAYARALTPLLASGRSETLNLVRMNTYRKAIEQIADEGEMVDWVDVDVITGLVYRQVNPIYTSTWMARTPMETAAQVVKLDISLILASVTTGYTHKRLLETARGAQKALKRSTRLF